MELEFKALGTTWFIKVDTDRGFRQSLKAEVLRVVNRFESDFSRFKPDSIVGRLNQGLQVESHNTDFHNLLNLSEKYWHLSNGRFTIFVGSILERWGYDQNYSLKFNSDLPCKVPRFQNAFAVRTERRFKLHDGVKLDFGGIGKGYLIDKVADLIFEVSDSVEGLKINAGGDLRIVNLEDEVYIEDPLDTQKLIYKYRIRDAGCATSSNSRRSWPTEDGEKGHIVDVISESTAKHLLSTHVISKTALKSDVLATILMTSTKDQIDKLYKSDDFAYLLITKERKIVRSSNWNQFTL